MYVRNTVFITKRFKQLNKTNLEHVAKGRKVDWQTVCNTA